MAIVEGEARVSDIGAALTYGGSREKFAIGYYLGRSAFASVYGAAGSLLVLLTLDLLLYPHFVRGRVRLMSNRKR
jgi:hypothetical protein